MAGAGVLAVAAVAGVIMVPQLFSGPSDPGCKVYANTALTSYNKAIHDMNVEATQATLNADLTTAVSDLSTAAGKAQGKTAKSALDGLLTELKKVQADVAKGSVPKSTVDALNSSAAAADNAC